jgi:hypothetical protein
MPRGAESVATASGAAAGGGGSAARANEAATTMAILNSIFSELTIPSSRTGC